MPAVDGDLRLIFRRKIKGHWVGLQGMPALPDSSFCVSGVEGFVEFKQTSAWAVSFRPTQPGWIMQRTTHGGRVWIGVRRWKTVESRDELWLVPGKLVLDLAKYGLKSVRLQSGVWTGGPSQWDWVQIERLLIS